MSTARPIANSADRSPDRGASLGSGSALPELYPEPAGAFETPEPTLQGPFFQHLFDSTPEAVVILRADGTVAQVNREFEHVFGFEASEVEGHPIDDLIVPPRERTVGADLTRRVAEGERAQGQGIRVRKDRRPIHVSYLAQPIFVDGGLVGVFVIYRDITDRKLEEAQRQKFVALVENSAEMIVMARLDGLIEYVNTAGLSLMGASLSDIVMQGLRLVDILPEEDRKDWYAAMDTLAREGQWSGELRLTDKHGRGRPVHASLFHVYKPDTDTPTGIGAIAQDISERKAAEEELRRTKELAETANVAKSRFLANMSHEIRTPMNAIIGMADLLWESELGDEQREYVRIFRSAGHTLLDLINDILDLSKIEAGAVELERTRFDLEKLVGRVADVFAVQAQNKGVELVTRIEPDVPRWVEGDPTRVRQVLSNLVGNAVKFTDAGEIDLEVRRDRRVRGLGAPRLLFSVRDSGTGIAPDRIDHVFDRFTQEDASTTRRFGGSGLGLSICRSLVELMGGNIWADSVHGHGSVFRFTVSIREAEGGGDANTPAQHTPDLAGQRVLVVDDHDANRVILREILSSWGAVVHEAPGGHAAVERLRRARDDGARFDMAVLDGHMPDLDGFGVAEEIARDPDLVGSATLMVSSLDRRSDIERSRRLRVDAYMVKPVQRMRLAETMLRAREARSAQRSVVPDADAPVDEPAPAPAATKGRRILLVEDTPDNRMLVDLYLKRTDHHLDMAENGQEALERYAEAAGAYDLVFMDMQMPVMDGYDATRAIRLWERGTGAPRVPILALTAHALVEEAARCLEAGCDAHLTKPIQKKVLIDAIERWAGGTA